MQILSLELENTKSYKQARIDFTQGMNAIVGHNGAGKSTILEAIGFVLFSSLNYKQDDFVRQDSKSAKVTVTFVSSLDQRVYQAVRRCGSSTQHLIFDPELDVKICEGKADALRFLSQNMGVEIGADLDKLFRDAVGVPQGTFTAAFLLGTSQRKSIFDPLLQVEEYEVAARKLRDGSNYLRDQQQAVDQQIARLEARLERLPQLEESLTQHTTGIATAQTELAQTKAQLDQATEKRIALETIRQQVIACQHEQHTAQQQVSNAEIQLAAAQQSQIEAENAVAIVQENQTGYSAYEAAQQDQKTLEVQAQERQGLQHEQFTLETTLARHQTEQANFQQELTLAVAAAQEVAVLADNVRQQVRLEDDLQLAQQQRTELRNWQGRVTELEQQLVRLRTRHGQLESQLQQGETLELTLQSTVENIAKMRAALDDRRAESAGCKAEGDALNEQNNDLENIATADCPVCEQPLSATHRSELLARNQSRLQALRKKYSDAQKQIKADGATLKEAETEQHQLEQKIRVLPRSDEVTALAGEIESSQTALTHAADQVTQFTAAPARLTELESALAALNNPRQRTAIAQQQAQRQPDIEARLGQVAGQFQVTQMKLSALSTQLTAFATLDDELTKVATALESHQMAYQAVLTHRQLAEQITARTAACEAAIAQGEQAQHAYDSVSQRLLEIEVQFDAEEYGIVLVQEQELRTAHGALQSRLEMLEKSQLQLTHEIEELQGQQKELDLVQVKAAKLAKQSSTLEMLRKLLRQAGPYITQALIRHVSDGATQIFGEIMQDHTRRLLWNEDYSITLEVDGRIRQFGQLSGGEQMSAAVAVRLSLLREMSNIDVAFFDEPTTNLDETRRESLARQILDIKGFKQLFVISHDDTFEQATENLIRVERVNGSSQVGAGFM